MDMRTCVCICEVTARWHAGTRMCASVVVGAAAAVVAVVSP